MLKRTRAGLAAARARGKVPGRRRAMTPADVAKARKLLDKGKLSSHEIAAMLKVSRATMFRELRKVREMQALGAQ